MSTTLTGSGIQSATGWAYSETNSAGQLFDNNGFSYIPPAFAAGTGAGQVDTKYSATVTIAPSGSFTQALTSFTDSFGNTVGMKRYRHIWIALQGGVTNQAQSINFGGGTHQLANLPQQQMRIGGHFENTAAGNSDSTGFAITNTTDTVTLNNNDSGNSATVQLVVLGCSA